MQWLSYFNEMKNNFMQKVNLLGFNFHKIFRQKKYLFFFLAVFTVSSIGLFLPRGAVHASLGDLIASGVLDLLSPIIYIIFWIFFFIAYIVAWFGAGIIDITLNPAIINSVLNFAPSMPLYHAWTIFRDVANLLFILILLLIALGTIFRSESYNLKKSLYKFILVIFLINFSGMITGLFIDFGNFLMYGVLKMMCPPAASATCFQDFYGQVMGVIDKLFWKYNFTGAFSFDFKDAASVGIAAIYTFIYGIVLMALGVFLVIRIAALSILIVLSPLAFFGYIAPGLEGLKNQWWDNLIKYVMYGPVFALMLYVSGLMAQNVIAVDPSVFETNPNLKGLGQDMALILTNIVPLIFLIGIIPVTKAFGIAGADAVFTGASSMTFGAMAKMGATWGSGQLFPGQNRLSKAGGRIGGAILKRSPKLNALWNGSPGRVGYRFTGVNTPGLKGHLKNIKNKMETGTRGLGGGKVGKAYDWMQKQRAGAETEIFKGPKTMGQYAEMGMRTMNPEFLRLGFKKWMEDSTRENYKIPLGSSPDERRKIEMMEAHKSVNDLKTAGGLDNPERVSDKAAKELKDGNTITFEILTKLLAAQDKQYKVLSSINRSNGLADTDAGAFTPNAEGWAQFLNVYKNKVGTGQASNFGQEVGNLAAKESNWSAGNIAYYENGADKIRDIGTTGSRTPAQQAEYDQYVKKNAEAMGKKSIGSKWNDMSSDNFTRKLANPANVGYSTLINGVNTPINISVNHEANEQGIEYIKGHMTVEEIEKNVGKGKPEEMKKTRDGIAYTIANNPGVFGANLTKAEKLRDRLTVVLGK